MSETKWCDWCQHELQTTPEYRVHGTHVTAYCCSKPCARAWRASNNGDIVHTSSGREARADGGTDSSTAEGKQQGIADITISAGYVMDMLEALDDVVDVATFRFDENGLGVAETVRYGAVHIDMKTTTTEKDAVNFDEPFYVRTGVRSLLRAVKDVANRHDVVEFNRTKNQLIVACGGPENHTKLDTGDPNAGEMHAIRPPEFELEATVRVRSSYLVGVVEGMAHASGNAPLSLRVTDGSVYVGYGKSKTLSETWAVPEHAVTHIEHDEDVQSWFTTNYLTDVLRGIPSTRTVKLSWSNQHPVHVNAGNWEYWVSPRIFRTDEDGDGDA